MLIKSVRIYNEVLDFLLGYNAFEGTSYTKYNIWQECIHKKIEELSGHKISDLKRYGIFTMKPLENQGKLGLLYEYMLPYIQKGREIRELNAPTTSEGAPKPVFDSKARLERIRAAEAHRLHS